MKSIAEHNMTNLIKVVEQGVKADEISKTFKPCMKNEISDLKKKIEENEKAHRAKA